MSAESPADHRSAPLGRGLPRAGIDGPGAAGGRGTDCGALVLSRAARFNSSRRDGLPLPALTGEHAVSQPIWRALGRLPDMVRPLLAWAGGGAAPPQEAG
jgi:hypothetical protein